MNKQSVSEIIAAEKAVILYFFNEHCSSCKSLREKLQKKMDELFPKILFLLVNAATDTEIPANFSVFSSPTILLFFDNKEFLRKSKFVAVEEFMFEIQRLYDLYFEENE